MRLWKTILLLLFFVEYSFRGGMAAPPAPILSSQLFQSQGERGTVTWSQVIAEPTLTGQALDSLEEWAETLQQAQIYLAYYRGVLNSKKTQEWMSFCHSNSTQSIRPFCFLQNWANQSRKAGKLLKSQEKNRIQVEAKAVIRGWIRALQERKYGFMEELPGSESGGESGSAPGNSPGNLPGNSPGHSKDLLPLAIQSLTRLHNRDLLARQLLAQKNCPPASLLIALGMNAENRFPNAEFQSLASGYYERAAVCGKGPLAQLASLRAGLLQIWKEDWEKADAQLEKLTGPEGVQLVSPEYRLRALYWRYYLGVQLKNTALTQAMSAALLREFPLSLYALLLQENSYSGPILHEFKNPKVQLRSRQSSDLNAVTRAVEVLLALGEKFSAFQLLRSYSEPVLASRELPFHLYWLTLFLRVEDRPGTFQFLARLIREEPSLMTRPFLELMYPLLYLDDARIATGAEGIAESGIDPFLILSVIRQESAFNEDALSVAGAMGLMQLQWDTAKRLGRTSKTLLRQPTINLRLGVKYLRNLTLQNQGDLQLALVAYNAGPGRLRQWMQRYPRTPILLFLDLLPLRETREYVTSIARNYWWYRRLYGASIATASASSTTTKSMGTKSMGESGAEGKSKNAGPVMVSSPFSIFGPVLKSR